MTSLPPRANAPRMARRVQSESEQTLRFIAKLALGALILRSFIVAPFDIPSESMLPRLLIGDYLLVAKWPYGYSRWSLPFGMPLLPAMHWADPTRGDVVVFRSPAPPPGDTNPEHASHDVIKRVIGLPGDTIQVRHGQVVLNGVAVPKDRVGDFVLPITRNFQGHCPAGHEEALQGQPVCRWQRYRETLPGGRTYTVLDTDNYPDRDDTGLYTVPAGTVFLMGDNRDNSADSRWASPQGMGYIPMDRLEGRALVGFFSTDGSASWVRPWTWFSAARPERIGGGF